MHNSFIINLIAQSLDKRGRPQLDKIAGTYHIEKEYKQYEQELKDSSGDDRGINSNEE